MEQNSVQRNNKTLWQIWISFSESLTKQKKSKTQCWMITIVSFNLCYLWFHKKYLNWVRILGSMYKYESQISFLFVASFISALFFSTFESIFISLNALFIICIYVLYI